MIKLDITARNFEANNKIQTYVVDKIGGLEKYLPRKSREVAAAQVVLEEDPSGREDNRFVCEVVITVPGAKLVSREGTLNMYAAIDIVEAKLKAQIHTYKDKTTAKPRRAKLLGRLLGRQAEAESAATEPSL